MNIFGTTGQERRAWLDRQGQNVLDAIQYYAGPGIPVNAFATIADAFNPVADIQRAGTAARGAVQPGISPMERLGYVGSAATDMASVLAPVAGAAYADDAARGLTEGLANLTMPADDAAGRFAIGEDGGLRLFHGSDTRFDEFDMNAPVSGGRSLGRAMYLTPDPQDAAGYGRYVYEYDVDGVNPLVARTTNYNFNVSDDYADYLRQQGHDSLITRLIDKDDAGNISSEYDYEMALYDPSKARLAKVYDTFYQSYVDELAGIEPTRVLPFDIARNSPDISGVDNAGISVANAAGDPALSPAEAQAQEVLDLLTSGRASEVTDDMLDLGDPVLNAQLNDYLFRNYDLPMDEASRMARAREMGFHDADLYHATPNDFQGFDLNASGFNTTIGDQERAVFMSDRPEGAASFINRGYVADFQPFDGLNTLDDARARYLEIDKAQGERAAKEWWANEVVPRSPTYQDYADGGNVMPLKIRTDNGFSSWNFYGRGYDSDQAVESILDAKAEGSDAVVWNNIVDGGFMGGHKKQNVVAHFDPTQIRSRFARFDPRLAHLRNLSAGVGGLGIAAGSQSEEERSEDINAILAKYGI